jgi:hypothetical protein
VDSVVKVISGEIGSDRHFLGAVVEIYPEFYIDYILEMPAQSELKWSECEGVDRIGFTPRRGERINL